MFQSTTNKAAASLNYALSGCHVLPLAPHGKEPIIPGGFKAASKDWSTVSNWWRQWPDANIGLPTGFINGFWALDIDGEEGENSLRLLEAQYGVLPKTIEVITGGGRHLYFQMPEGILIGNSASKIARKLDVRGNGGYVVAPPSIHKSGKAYRFASAEGTQLAAAAPWLLSIVQANITSEDFLSFPNLHTLIKGVEEGGRNDAVARIAGKLMRQEKNDPQFVLEICLAWNEARCKPPLSPQEVGRTVDSIAGAELRRRKGGA